MKSLLVSQENTLCQAEAHSLLEAIIAWPASFELRIQFAVHRNCAESSREITVRKKLKNFELLVILVLFSAYRQRNKTLLSCFFIFAARSLGGVGLLLARPYASLGSGPHLLRAAFSQVFALAWLLSWDSWPVGDCGELSSYRRGSLSSLAPSPFPFHPLLAAALVRPRFNYSRRPSASLFLMGANSPFLFFESRSRALDDCRCCRYHHYYRHRRFSWSAAVDLTQTEQVTLPLVAGAAAAAWRPRHWQCLVGKDKIPPVFLLRPSCLLLPLLLNFLLRHFPLQLTQSVS